MSAVLKTIRPAINNTICQVGLLSNSYEMKF